MADSRAVYALLDDGPHAGERVLIEPEASGAPPRTIELADPAGPPPGTVVYVLVGPHHNADWWLYRRVRPGDGN